MTRTLSDVSLAALPAEADAFILCGGACAPFGLPHAVANAADFADGFAYVASSSLIVARDEDEDEDFELEEDDDDFGDDDFADEDAEEEEEEEDEDEDEDDFDDDLDEDE